MKTQQIQQRQQIQIQKLLFERQDLKYREFHAKLMPTVDPETVIGIRIPVLRKLAKELWQSAEGRKTSAIDFTKEDRQVFMASLPHIYYEENNLHGFFIEFMEDYEECICALEKFLPYVDNWATCDLMAPKALGRHRDKLLQQIKVWLADGHPYTVRYAIGQMMRYYLDEDFEMSYPELVAGVESGEYYVNMMRAWYFATALAKQYDLVLPYLENNRLDLWTHNKTIQKAVESFRITPEQKVYLKGLRRKRTEAIRE